MDMFHPSQSIPWKFWCILFLMNRRWETRSFITSLWLDETGNTALWLVRYPLRHPQQLQNNLTSWSHQGNHLSLPKESYSALPPQFPYYLCYNYFQSHDKNLQKLVLCHMMSDSEEETKDKQLKIAILGDGSAGKVRRRIIITGNLIW